MSLQFAELTSRFNMSEMKRPNVRRCLFGRPDPEKQTDYFEKQERILRFEEDGRRFREAWNFDPVAGRPIEGKKFEYEIIHVKSSVPSFYTKGYTRKPRPVVRIVRDSGFCSFNDSSRPAKRKLDLESQENDENEVLDKRVPSKGDMITVPEMHHLSATLPDFKDNSLFDSPAGLISFSSPASSVPVLSPTSRNRDITTPPCRPRSLVQSSMKDFLSNKKQRLLNTKSLPRT